jgi:hypothetical protein
MTRCSPVSHLILCLTNNPLLKLNATMTDLATVVKDPKFIASTSKWGRSHEEAFRITRTIGRAWVSLEAELEADTLAKIDVAYQLVESLLRAIDDPRTLSRKSIENLLLEHEGGKFARATAFFQHLAAITTWAYDPQLDVDMMDDVKEDDSPASTVSHDDPHIAKRAIELEGFCLTTAFLLPDLVATTYQTHDLVRQGYELVFV